MIAQTRINKNPPEHSAHVSAALELDWKSIGPAERKADHSELLTDRYSQIAKTIENGVDSCISIIRVWRLRATTQVP